MKSIVRRFRYVLLSLIPVSVSLFVGPRIGVAMDTAIPVDLFEYTIGGTGDNGDGYYYMDPFVRALGPFRQRGFGVIMDTDGEIVWYRSMGLNSHPYVHLRRFDDGTLMGSQDVNPPSYSHFYNGAGEFIDFLPGHHPTLDAERDSHEILLAEGGGYWTLWVQHRPVDMSELWPGGDPNASVGFHIIELWDEDHNPIWHWDSYDHLDELPIIERTEINDLTKPEFEHIHLNAFEILPDGDILCSARQMSVVFRIDRDTGDVEWCLGGGPLNDFSLVRGNDIPFNMPLEFYAQHDVRYTPDGRFSMFDNGFRHPVPKSYVREYELDEDAMTARLVWAYENPVGESAFITGSFRRLQDGHRLINWGNMYPSYNASELDEDGNVVWSLEFEEDEVYAGWQPGMYRIFKSPEFTPDVAPYISVTERDYPEQDRLYFNWFGHQDEVAGFRLYTGFAPGNLDDIGQYNSGDISLPYVETARTVYVQARALNSDGEEFGPWSNLWTIRKPDYVFDSVPLHDHVPETGGVVTWEINLDLPFQITLPNVSFWTEVTAPDGTQYGPLYQNTFTLQTPVQGTYPNAQQVIPAMAPPGIYRYTVNLGYPGNTVLTDSFYIYKQGGGVGSEGENQGSGWKAASVGELMPAATSP